MKNIKESSVEISKNQCTKSLAALEDALYVIGGKWKLKVIVALKENGPTRFNELQRSVTGISARVLSNELKDLELDGFLRRSVYTQIPVIIEYELTDYTYTLNPVLNALVEWGTAHHDRIRQQR